MFSFGSSARYAARPDTRDSVRFGYFENLLSPVWYATLLRLLLSLLPDRMQEGQTPSPKSQSMTSVNLHAHTAGSTCIALASLWPKRVGSKSYFIAFASFAMSLE